MKSKMNLQFNSVPAAGFTNLFDSPASGSGIESPLSWSALPTPSPLTAVSLDLQTFAVEDHHISRHPNTHSTSVISSVPHHPHQLPFALVQSLASAAASYSPLTPEPIKGDQPTPPMPPGGLFPDDSAAPATVTESLVRKARALAGTPSGISGTDASSPLTLPPFLDGSSTVSTFVSSRRNTTEDRHSSNMGQFCKICGDNALGKNFGVVTCGSCKIFFRRNISSKERLQCRQGNHCSISKSNRRNCASCRLTKCIRLGMRVKQNKHTSYTSTILPPSESSSSMDIMDSIRSQISRQPKEPVMMMEEDEEDELVDVVNDNEEFDDLPTLVPIENVMANRENTNIVQTGVSHNGVAVISSLPTYQRNTPTPTTINQTPHQSSTIVNNHRNDSDAESIPNLVPLGTTSVNSVSVIKENIYRNIGNKHINTGVTNGHTGKKLVKEEEEEEEEEDEEAEEEDEPEEAEEMEVEQENEVKTENKPIDLNSRYYYDQTPSTSSGYSSTIFMIPGMCCADSGNAYCSQPYGHLEGVGCDRAPLNEINACMQRALIPFNPASMEEEDAIEQRDGFNFSQLQTNFELNNCYNYNNYYTDNYYYYYRNCGTHSGHADSPTSGTSVELCKVEAKNFGDQIQNQIAELCKYKSLIRIKLGLEYNSDLSDCFRLFSKEREKIDRLNSSCRTISAKPHSSQQLCAIFSSLERGIFHANKSFKLYEEFWGQNTEFRELIRQNETGFNRKKNKLLHMLYHLRGVQNFDEQQNAWAIFNGANDNTFTLIKLDMFQHSIKKEMSNAHRQYITSFPREWRLDPTIFNLMTYLLLFGVFRNLHTQFESEKLHYFKYLYLFKRYFESMYGDETKALQMLNWMLKLISELSPLCSECLTACTHSLNPQVLRKIGPNYAACLLSELQQKQLQQTEDVDLPTTTEVPDESIEEPHLQP